MRIFIGVCFIACSAWADSGFAIITGGVSSRQQSEPLADAHRQSPAWGQVATANWYPKLVGSESVKGLKPGFSVMIAGFCAQQADADAVVAALTPSIKGVYTRPVDVSAEELRTCPVVSKGPVKNFTVELLNQPVPDLRAVIAGSDEVTLRKLLADPRAKESYDDVIDVFATQPDSAKQNSELAARRNALLTDARIQKGADFYTQQAEMKSFANHHTVEFKYVVAQLGWASNFGEQPTKRRLFNLLLSVIVSLEARYAQKNPAGKPSFDEVRRINNLRADAVRQLIQLVTLSRDARIDALEMRADDVGRTGPARLPFNLQSDCDKNLKFEPESLTEAAACVGARLSLGGDPESNLYSVAANALSPENTYGDAALIKTYADALEAKALGKPFTLPVDCVGLPAAEAYQRTSAEKRAEYKFAVATLGALSACEANGENKYDRELRFTFAGGVYRFNSKCVELEMTAGLSEKAAFAAAKKFVKQCGKEKFDKDACTHELPDHEGNETVELTWSDARDKVLRISVCGESYGD